jgi:hypothetical protein
MTLYRMTPIKNGTRMRTDHNTYADVITSFNAGQILEGEEFWQAAADGNEVKKGDLWLKVNKVDGQPIHPSGWTAFSHKGIPISKNWQEIGSSEPEPGGVPVIPEWFILTSPDGTQTKFIREE